MKRILALLMTLLILMSYAVISTAAAEPAKTKISVNKGDEIVYTLNLTLPEKLVGWDMSIYYDSSKLKVKEVTDYSGATKEDEWQSFINPSLKDEIKYVYSYINGLKCDKREFIKVKFEATSSKKVDTNISYYVRFLYPDSMEQFKEYTFTCDVTVNGSKIADDAQPELNVDKPQTQGYFVNSVTGKGADADVNISGKEQGGNNSTSEKPESNTTSNKKPTTGKTDSNKPTDAQSVQNGATVDSASADSASTDQAGVNANTGNIFISVWFWIIIAILVLGLGAGGYFIFFQKKTK